MATRTQERCPECGAPVHGGLEACQAVWEALFYGHALGPIAAFDAYCMQHPARYGRSAKSYAAHLMRLCCAQAYNGDPNVYTAIQRWLNGRRALEKPPVPAFRGALTIVDVDAATPATRGLVVVAWIDEVWAAYAPQHALAHDWIHAALSAL